MSCVVTEGRVVLVVRLVLSLNTVFEFLAFNGGKFCSLARDNWMPEFQILLVRLRKFRDEVLGVRGLG